LCFAYLHFISNFQIKVSTSSFISVFIFIFEWLWLSGTGVNNKVLCFDNHLFILSDYIQQNKTNEGETWRSGKAVVL
jgi:hypothetical protein